MKRLTWLLGPPGAGKSTYASQFPHGIPRVVEINQMLFPLIKGTKINHGILTAIHQCIELIKELELRTENINEKPLMVVAGIAELSVILPLTKHEQIWLILPSYKRWKLQFEQRPLDKGNGKKYYENYTDYKYSEKHYYKYQKLLKENQEIKLIDTDFDENLLGKLYYKKI